MIPGEAKTLEEMESHSKKLVQKSKALTGMPAVVAFQNDIMMELASESGYPTCTSRILELLKQWKKYRQEANCVTNGRHGRFRSSVTGNLGLDIPPYMTIFDDSLENWLTFDGKSRL